MKKSYHNRIVASCIMASLLVGCALPMASTPTQFVFPTPNLTMTALFQIPPTQTSAPQPSATQGVPTSSTPSATLSPTAANCTNLASFVSETVADLTYIAPGTAFTKIWTLKNAGTCTWGSGYALVFDSGDQMGGPASVPMTASVPPGAVYNFTVNLTAPATLGQYQGYWKLQSPQGIRFGIDAAGKAFWVRITTAVLAPACSAQTKRPDSYGGVIEAYFTVTPPTIDGVLTDWDPLVNDVPYDVFGDTDNDAGFTLKWDANNLYLAVKVADDNLFNSVTDSNAPLMYKGDSVEILLDRNLKGDYCNTWMDDDDYQLGISPGSLPTPGGFLPFAYLWYPTAIKGTKIATIASALTVGPDPIGYIIEAAIPWGAFGGYAPDGSENYGFAFSVSDADHSTEKQDGMISTAPKRTIFSNPMLWGTLQIEIQTGP
jgi:hypothetical protein